MHEQMISKDDAMYTYNFNSYYKILPTINNNKKFYNINKKQKLVDVILLMFLILIKHG